MFSHVRKQRSVHIGDLTCANRCKQLLCWPLKGVGGWNIVVVIECLTATHLSRNCHEFSVAFRSNRAVITAAAAAAVVRTVGLALRC